MKVRVWTLLLSFFISPVMLISQDDPSKMIGGNHYTGYSIGDIDTVSIINGNVMLHIPVYSLKQKGGQPLTFSVTGNNLRFQQYTNCAEAFGDPCGIVTYGYEELPKCTDGIGLHSDQELNVCRTTVVENQYWDGSVSGKSMWPLFDVVRGNINSSRLYRDFNAQTKLRTTDGSGLLMSATSTLFTDQSDTSTPSPVNSAFDIYDSQGVVSHFDAIPVGNYGYVVPEETQRTDSNGNIIYRGNLGTDPQRFYYKDTLNRLFVDAPKEIKKNIGIGSNVSSCPSSAGQHQPAVSSYSWTVPGPNGDVTYVFCYADVFIRTNFFGFGPGAHYSNGSQVYNEISGAFRMLQSVLLPDGTSWKLEYDAADPNDSNSTSYGDLTRIVTPQGGSISYTYATYAAYPPPPSTSYSMQGSYRGLATRTTSDGIGSGSSHVSTWEYHVDDSSTTTPFTRTTRVVSPLEAGQTVADETLHIYGIASGSDAREPSVEIERRSYQGSAASGVLLESVGTLYHATQGVDATPYDNAVITDASILPTSVSTTHQGLAQVTSYPSYDAGIYTVQTACNKSFMGTGPSPQYSCSVPNSIAYTKQVTLGLNKDVIRYNYSGAGANHRELTTYEWELDSTYFDANLIKAPYTVTSTDDVDSVTTTYGYDDNSNGSPQGAHGNVTSISKSGTLGGTVTTSTVYDSNGRPTQSFDARNNKTEYEYNDAATGLVTKVKRPETNSIAHNDSYTYSSSNGQILTHTDENGNVSHYEYDDPLGRVTKIRIAAANGESTKTVDYSVPRVYTVKQDKDHTGDGLIITSTTVDGLGRPIQTTGPDGSIVDTTYTASGAVATKSNPHVSSTLSSDGITTFAYDALGRKTSQVPPGAVAAETEHWSYSGNSTDYKIGSTRRWQQKADAFGQLTDVYEDPDVANLHTSYTYDFLGNLKTVNQQGRTRSFTYDSLSRLIQAYNPETRWLCYGTTGGAVPDGTNCTQGYDGNGNLEHKTDARAVTVNYAYDELNRLTSKTFSGTATNTPSTCYQYDSSSAGYPNGNFKGRMSHEWTQMGSCASSLPSSGIITRRSVKLYDAVGNVRVEERCALNNCSSSTFTPFSLHFGFDLANNLTDYDNGLGNLNLSNYYDPAGRLYKVGSSAYDGTHPNSLYNVESFLPSGTPSEFNYGLYLHGTQSIDNRLRPQKFTVTGK